MEEQNGVELEQQDEFEVDLAEFLRDDELTEDVSGAEPGIEDKPEVRQEPEPAAGAAPEAESQAGDGKPDEGQAEEKKAEEPQASENQELPERFTFQYGREQREVSREELAGLARQGLEYEAVRGQRDNLAAELEPLRKFQEDNRDAVELLEDMAKEANLPIPDFLQLLSVNRYAAQYERQGVDQKMARVLASERVGREKAERAARRASQAEQSPAPENGEARQPKAAQRVKEDVGAFIRRFPDVKPEAIPREVWDRVSAGARLADAYAAWKQDQDTAAVREENKQLKLELEAAKQNGRNRQRSIGSQATSAGETGRDDFLAALMSDD